MAKSFGNGSFGLEWISFSRIVRFSCAEHNGRGNSGTGFSLWVFLYLKPKPHRLKPVPLNSFSRPAYELRYLNAVFRHGMQRNGPRLRLIQSGTITEENRNDFCPPKPFTDLMHVHRRGDT